METVCAYYKREAESLIKANFIPEMVKKVWSETIPLC